MEGGALKGANAQFGSFLSGSPITVAAGATLDLGGDGSAFANLTGAGVVTNSGPATTLFLDEADFRYGTNTYTGTTTIDSGDGVELGAVGRPGRSAAA